jgi:hypothetical protein
MGQLKQVNVMIDPNHRCTMGGGRGYEKGPQKSIFKKFVIKNDKAHMSLTSLNFV